MPLVVLGAICRSPASPHACDHGASLSTGPTTHLPDPVDSQSILSLDRDRRRRHADLRHLGVPVPRPAGREGRAVTEAIWRDMPCFAGLPEPRAAGRHQRSGAPAGGQPVDEPGACRRVASAVRRPPECLLRTTWSPSLDAASSPPVPVADPTANPQALLLLANLGRPRHPPGQPPPTPSRSCLTPPTRSPGRRRRRPASRRRGPGPPTPTPTGVGPQPRHHDPPGERLCRAQCTRRLQLRASSS